ncbi:MAG: GxxExxY protein [Acidobacteria bacterium]|nr:GxxExxY protein [Acidobacteriota bacterium]
MLTDRTAIDFLSYRTIGCALRVHRALGPGVLELPNTLALAEELSAATIRYRRDVPVAIIYKGKPLGCGYRLDLLVEDTLIVEVKSVRELTDVHKKQLLSYLKLTGRPIGLLINFNVPLLQQGITRLINDGDRGGPAVAEIRDRSVKSPAKLSAYAESEPGDAKEPPGPL